MDPPQPRPDWIETVAWLELWLAMLRRDPECGPTVLPFAEADLRRLKQELQRSAENERSEEDRQEIARAAIRFSGELAIEIAKRIVSGDICGSIYPSLRSAA